MKTNITTTLFRKVFTKPFSIFFDLFLASASIFAQAENNLSFSNFNHDSLNLTQYSNRLSGSDNNKKAGDFILSELAKTPGQVMVQRFEFPIEKIHICELRCEGKVIKLLPFVADGIVPCTLPPEGVTAEILYLGNITEEELKGKNLKGKIIVADITAKFALSKLFRRDAKAVIFIGSSEADNSSFRNKVTDVSVGLPRFYISEKDAKSSGLVSLKSGTLFSKITWERGFGRNIFLWLKGTNPLFKYKAPEYVILSANYDSFGYVPQNSPSTQEAENCAALLETARFIASHPSRRSVLIAFFDNHTNYHQGARNFYSALRRNYSEGIRDPHPVREQYLEKETEFIQKLQTFLQKTGEFYSSDTAIAKIARERLKDYSKSIYSELQRDIAKLRMRRKNLRIENKPTEGITEELNKQVKVQKQWQSLMISILNRKQDSEGAKIAKKKALQYFTALSSRRLKELKRAKSYLADNIALSKLLKESIPVMHASYSFLCDFNKWAIIPEKSLRPATRKNWIETTQKDQGENISDFAWDVSLGNNYSSHIQSTTSATLFASALQIPAVNLTTVASVNSFYGIPDKRITSTQSKNIFAQANAFIPFLKVLCDEEFISSPNLITRNRKVFIDDYQWDDNQKKVSGHRVMSIPYGDTSPSKIENNAVVYIRHRKKTENDVLNSFRCFTDANGCFSVRTLENEFKYFRVTAGTFNKNGILQSINCYSPKGSRASVEKGWSKAGYHSMQAAFHNYTIIILFKGSGGRIIGTNLPFAAKFKMNAFKLLNGLSNSNYKYYHFDFDETMGIGVYNVEDPFGVKFIYEDPKEADEVAILINASPKNFAGTGYGPGIGDGLVNTSYKKNLDLNLHMASDLYLLNESRLKVLRSKNIIRNDLELIQSNAKELYGKYKNNIKSGNQTKALYLANLLAVLEQKIYRPIVAVTNDMVLAVTLLLLLALPFSFAMQSLVFPTYDIYKKIMRFVIIFILSFGVLYLVHPAFSFASMPAVIIIAFVIMVLSGFVIYLIGSKFSYEVKKMQGIATSAHTFTVKSIGNMGAAISLAISTMRRRPARTCLTIGTVLLLTFTILSFASFQAEKGVNDFYLGASDPVSRILIRRKGWKNMNIHEMQQFKNYLSKDFKIHGRYWKVLELSQISTMDELQVPIYLMSGKYVTASAIMTLDRLEIEKLPALKNLLKGDINLFLHGKGVFIADSLAKSLGVKNGDKVKISGVNTIIAGTYNPQIIMAARQIDDSPLLPIDFNITQQALGQFESKGSATSDTSQDDLLNEVEALGTEALEPINADSVIIAPTSLHDKLNLTMKAIVAYPKKHVEIDSVAHDLAIMNTDGVYVNNSGERSFVQFGDKVGVGGLSDIIIPLLLGGLIIFSTMLGSIIDREQEIYTFSALGLAPRNIAMLFFVESAIYAVIGGFGGYLLSQIITRILDFLATFGIFRAPELNYSSSTAINTILLVMFTVMVSTIYPAIRAAKKATADTTSTWKVPPPIGNICEFNFPFTISELDISGLICFLQEYFSAYSDRTIGQFAVDNVEIFIEKEHAMLAIRTNTWLQPFDEGISQVFELTARPSEIEEVCEVHVKTERLSGPPGSWRRANTIFMKDLRQQFLLWRTLDDDIMDHYLTKGDEAEKKLEV